MSGLALEVKVYRSIHDVVLEEWDSILSVNDVFNTSKFLKDVEEANVENSEFWYLTIYDKHRLVATAVLSAFIINLDIFVGAGSLINAIRKVWPGFLKIKILMCGIPASLGQKNIAIIHSNYENEILDLICKKMNAISQLQKIKYQAFKEFKESEISTFRYLNKNGFFQAFSLPYTSIDIRWNDFKTYINDLRHGYKRQILTSLKKINKELDCSLITNDSRNSISPTLCLVDSKECTPEVFYNLYLKVMNRATSKLEVLNLAFFENFFKSHSEELIFIVLKDAEVIHGAAVLISHGQELTFTLIGKNDEKDKYDTYFNLITAIVKYGIENKYKKLHMGQTSYYPKQRVGALPINEYIFFMSTNRILHFVLKSINKVIFPITKLDELRVFKR